MNLRYSSCFCLALLGCTGQRQPLPSHGIKTPLDLASAAGASQDAPRRPVDPAATSLGLAEIAPLLADSRLASVAQAVEADNSGGAARALELAMARADLAPSEILRWHYLLARLLEKAGELPSAAAAFEFAAGEDWPLRDYARLGAARALGRAGQPAVARAELTRISSEPPLDSEVRLLTAEFAIAEHDVDAAIVALRAELENLGAHHDRTALSLELAAALLERTDLMARSANADELQADRAQALELVRRVRFEHGSDGTAIRAEQLERRILGSMPEPMRARLAVLTPEEELERIRGLLVAKTEDAAEQAADGLLKRLPISERWGVVGCEAALLGAKAAAKKRMPARAVELLADPLRHCQGDDWRARSLYLAGSSAAQDGRHMQAVRYFEQLEREVPGHSLADDARVKAAQSYFELGVEAEFTRLLSSLPEDYPGGDLVLDGCFRLALRRIEKGDWSGAASVLDRAAALAAGHEYARGTEFSGRERYFRARAWIETGEPQRGYDELSNIVLELPLSYYMLHAYSRLKQADPARALEVRQRACQRADGEPFAIKAHPDFSRPGFLRAKELLWVGETELAEREIEELGLAQAGVAPEILWGVVLLYARAGAAKLSYSLARGLLTDWLRHWPAGDWVRAWQLGFPRPFEPLVAREAHKNGLPESLVYAVMREESAFDPGAVSPAEAYGLMQLIVPTANAYAHPLGLPFDVRSLKTPAINVALGCRVLAKLRETFGQNPLLAIAGYNAGPGRPRHWLRQRPNEDFDVWVELIPFVETRRYTKRVLASRSAYAYLYESGAGDEALLLPTKVIAE